MQLWMICLCALMLAGNEGTDTTKSSPLVFEEDLRITPESTDVVFGGEHVFLTVDDTGQIYVTDSPGNQVIVFDTQGNEVHRLGGSGQGPGEFQMLLRYQILDKGAVAFEPMALSFFDQQNVFKQKKSLMEPGSFFQRIYFSRDGKHAFGYRTSENGAQASFKVDTLLMSSEMEEKIVVSSLEGKVPAFRRAFESLSRQDLIVTMSQLIGMGNNSGMAAFLSNGNVVTAKTRDYTLKMFDDNLKQFKEVSGKYKPKYLKKDELNAVGEVVFDMMPFPPEIKERIDPEMVAEALELAGWDKTPAIYGMLAMDNGGFLVVTAMNVSGISVADVYDAHGTYLGETSRPNWGLLGRYNPMGSNEPVMVFRGKYAYTVEYVDDDYEVVRYRISMNP